MLFKNCNILAPINSYCDKEIVIKEYQGDKTLWKFKIKQGITTCTNEIILPTSIVVWCETCRKVNWKTIGIECEHDKQHYVLEEYIQKCIDVRVTRLSGTLEMTIHPVIIDKLPEIQYDIIKSYQSIIIPRDIKIKTKDISLHCHSAILYQNTKLKDNFELSVSIPFSSTIVKSVLQYLYTGKTSGDYAELYNCAKWLEFKPLLTFCHNKLVEEKKYEHLKN